MLLIIRGRDTQLVCMESEERNGNNQQPIQPADSLALHTIATILAALDAAASNFNKKKYRVVQLLARVQ